MSYLIIRALVSNISATLIEYTYAGRAKGLAELRGLEHAIYNAVGN